jgi:hypothetical protein
MYLPVGSVLYFNVNNSWQKITEHNRAPVSIESNRIEKSQRMSNGTLRKLFIADKTNISTSWSMVPSRSTLTVDGGWGAEDLRDFYHGAGVNTFQAKVSYNGVREDIYIVSFNQFSMTLAKRNVKGKTSDTAQEFWDISIGLEQV